MSASSDARLIDGNFLSAEIRDGLKSRIAAIKESGGPTPGLAVVLVGDDPASQVYVRNKNKRAVEVGINSIEHRLSERTSESDLLALIDRLNADPAVNGILVQLPLPRHIDADKLLLRIDPAKDVDGFHPVNAGRLATGAPGLVPCTPLGCLYLLKRELGDLTGKRALVLGRSNIVGKPVAQLLLRESATVTIAHSKTNDLPGECLRADILVAAVGRPEMVRGDWLKPGVVVIDVGINRLANGQLVGDVAFAEAVKIASAITPVPGGVGPMTIAFLLRNTLQACCAQNGLLLEMPGMQP